MTITPPALRIGCLIVAAALALPTTAAAKDPVVVPDFTKGAKIPRDAKHDWNLGPTGLRGWIYCDQLVTTDARQILVTKIDKGSPAADAFQVGDVILGVGGKPFSYDPRTELGKAITVAESKAGEGKLALTRWRAGKTEEVVLRLPVLGSYGVTAPFDCDKSKLLLEQGCKALAARMAKQGYAEMDAIPRSLNALALLASGNAEYLPLVKKEAEWAAGYSARSMQTWYYGYVMVFLSEYVLATGDESVLPGLKRLALESAKGQSAVGSWGHGFAIPDGRLGGYGMMNSPGMVLTTGLVLARETGVKDAEVTTAIERGAKLLRFYTGKGAIPYGDHHPWIEGHEDNGKCGMAAVLFNALGEPNAAEFFSRMSVAAHGSERDCGHCGNYFNMLWAMPSVALSGSNATGAWMKEFGTWYFDLARRWDGSYPHQGPPENEEDSFDGWDATGTYLLAYAVPLKKVRLTGSGKGTVKQLDAAGADALIADGRGWDNKDRTSAYDKLSGEQLVERLGSWSPIVRERAAMALGRRKDAPVPAVVKLLDAPGLESRCGACQAIIALGKRGEPALERLRKCLTDKDLWLRIKAAEALAKIGPVAEPVVPKLLELLAEVDKANDPRGMQQRYLTFALFDGDGMLRGSLDGVDREALYKAVRAGLKNEDGRARSSLTSVYRNLSALDIKPLLPAIHRAIVEPAPSGEMFADGIRVEGLRLFAKHRIEEGIQACVKYTREQNPWESQLRTPELMKILLSYGTHAKAVIPELTKIANYFEKDEPDFPKELMKRKAKSVRDTIRAIEAAKETPELIRLDKEPGAKEPKAAPAKAPLKVFILAGQSNMQGHANVSTFDDLANDPKTAPLLKEMRGPDGKPRVCEKVWISSVGCLGDAYSDLTEAKGKLTAGFGARGKNNIGPEFTFGLTLEKQLNEPVLIVKTSWGGRSLHTDFRPPSAGPFVLAKETQKLWDENPKGAHGIPKAEDRPKFYAEKAAATGVYYREMIAHIKKVLKDVKRVVPDYDEKQGYELAGFVWFQGFNDYVDGGVYPNQGKAGGYDLYADLLGHFIRDVRKDLSAPKLPFVIGVMGIDGLKGNEKGEMKHFREAQRKPTALAEFKGNVVAVETAPFWDDDLEAFVERKERLYDKLEQGFRKAKPRPTEPEKEATRKKALDEEFKPDELKRLNAGVSNGGYHYLGAAKIMAPIGRAFAEATVALSKGEKPKDPPATKPPGKTGSDDRFAISNVEGWTVYLNRDLPKLYPAETAKTLEHLKWELYQVKLAAPAAAVTNMQEKNAIWIEYREQVDLSYHPGRSWLIDRGYTIPKDPASFMSLSVATHLGDSYRHPFVVFHELAHGYDFHFIGKGNGYGNKESQTNYERMMSAGKYEKVKLWNGKEGSHYARSNRMEYWAESTEAYFGVNDFYPFVRAELREHDPQMSKFVERYWGVDAEQGAKKEKDLVDYQQEQRQAAAGVPKPAGAPGAVDNAAPTAQYDKRSIAGWTVYVSPRLTDQPGASAAMTALLNYKLHMINHFVAEPGRRQLQEVPIWLEEGRAGPYVRYCGSGKQLADERENPDKLRGVEVRDPLRMRRWALLQQSDLLHELALAYYDRHAVKDSGLGRNVRVAYQKAANDGKYKSVLRFDGKRVPHPALAGEKDYFAELMESYFLVNDHYPFIRCELKDQDPTGYALIAGLWEGNPAR